ncbi:hypothetical protein L596_021279 [Steinernema carpocapsae]|uniref:Uncharacterized protein n=1 Tax=Steinernema carpocapsae TaxID=34508 RepID=A0A4U5MI66_STECR|nr:hypothetical protein L596_021279 [Steinernema carpocapsae]
MNEAMFQILRSKTSMDPSQPMLHGQPLPVCKRRKPRRKYAWLKTLIYWSKFVAFPVIALGCVGIILLEYGDSVKSHGKRHISEVSTEVENVNPAQFQDVTQYLEPILLEAFGTYSAGCAELVCYWHEEKELSIQFLNKVTKVAAEQSGTHDDVYLLPLNVLKESKKVDQTLKEHVELLETKPSKIIYVETIGHNGFAMFAVSRNEFDIFQRLNVEKVKGDESPTSSKTDLPDKNSQMEEILRNLMAYGNAAHIELFGKTENAPLTPNVVDLIVPTSTTSFLTFLAHNLHMSPSLIVDHLAGAEKKSTERLEMMLSSFIKRLPCSFPTGFEGAENFIRAYATPRSEEKYVIDETDRSKLKTAVAAWEKNENPKIVLGSSTLDTLLENAVLSFPTLKRFPTIQFTLEDLQESFSFNEADSILRCETGRTSLQPVLITEITGREPSFFFLIHKNTGDSCELKVVTGTYADADFAEAFMIKLTLHTEVTHFSLPEANHIDLILLTLDQLWMNSKSELSVILDSDEEWPKKRLALLLPYNLEASPGPTQVHQAHADSSYGCDHTSHVEQFSQPPSVNAKYILQAWKVVGERLRIAIFKKNNDAYDVYLFGFSRKAHRAHKNLCDKSSLKCNEVDSVPFYVYDIDAIFDAGKLIGEEATLWIRPLWTGDIRQAR